MVLTAFTSMPEGGEGDYLAEITSRYPELLQPGIDEAIAALKRDLASGEDNAMGFILDVIAENIHQQRTRNAAMEKGNRQQKQSQRRELADRQDEEEERIDDDDDDDDDGELEEDSDDEFDEAVAATDPKRWSLSRKQFDALIEQIKSPSAA